MRRSGRPCADDRLAHEIRGGLVVEPFTIEAAPGPEVERQADERLLPFGSPAARAKALGERPCKVGELRIDRGLDDIIQCRDAAAITLNLLEHRRTPAVPPIELTQ